MLPYHNSSRIPIAVLLCVERVLNNNRDQYLSEHLDLVLTIAEPIVAEPFDCQVDVLGLDVRK